MSTITRRDVLKASLAAGAALPLGCARPQAPTISQSELPRRVLGKTGARVTILGLGCAWIAKDPATPTRAVVEAALDCGVRYFDTAPNYDRSEESLGPLLKGVRDQVFLVTKLDHLSAKEAEADLRQSLKRLRTDHVDLLLLHGVGIPNGWEDVRRITAADGVLAYLRKAKRDGLTRFIGMSVHPPHGPALELLDRAADLDVAMPFLNALAVAEHGAALAERCHRMGMGLAAMKVLGGEGQLAKDYDRAFRYPLSLPGVACAVVGAKSAAEVRRAAQAAREFRPLSAAEMQQAAKAGARLVAAAAGDYALLRPHFALDAGGHCHV
ncbi:MAG TPA: aldo/keto reductase [Planctomycetota bacterium]|nr:aldo/keto reductase [Planctomycetota bacterium]HRR79594.1 aldo/keto reductase [Planctomycetota bacterium]HRT95029.1 aldo/keto reductase [Planctomycetota bacterium]